MEGIIKSVGLSQSEIIKNILTLHCEGKDIDCDPTYSKGNFYKKTGINEPRYKFDILPLVEGVEEADCRKLPLEDNSVEVVMFDPPFIISKGPSLKTDKKGSNIISSRFSSFESYVELLKMYGESIEEMHRILKKGGHLIFKCQDQVSGGKQYFVHLAVNWMAESQGFYPKDLFILVAKNRISSGKWKIQRHARKHHCYFWVFKKI